MTEAEWSALLLSLRVAIASAALTLLPGVAVGWLLARKRFFGRSLVDAIVHLPLVLPPVAIGYLLLRTLGRRSALGGLLDIAFTWKAAAVASMVMAFPLMVRAVRLSIELVDRRLEEAARTLGAGPWRVFFSVTLPLALPGVLTGLLLAFARSLGEFGATISFAGNIEGETRTLPLAIYSHAQTPGGDAPALRLVVLSLLLSLGTLLLSEILARRVARRSGIG